MKIHEFLFGQMCKSNRQLVPGKTNYDLFESNIVFLSKESHILPVISENVIVILWKCIVHRVNCFRLLLFIFLAILMIMAYCLES